MYTEEYEHKGFPIKNFLVKLVLVIIFVLLLIWLLPKIISPVVKTESKTKSSSAGSTCDLSSLKALTSQIYADNVERMKNAAISYYTSDRLPTAVGESKTMTLSDMIGKKLITPLIDKNNKAVDVEKSYVKITKQDNEYVLKVNVVDSEKDDYILVHLGCYAYCESYLCQKQTTKQTVIGKGGSATTTSVVPIITPTPVVVKPNCEYKDGKYYDGNGNRVSELNYIISCQAPKCKNVNGYYFGKTGKNITKTQYLSECTTPATHSCEYKNGKYYDANGKVVSEINYIISCQAPKCKVVNGYYFGKNGNNVSKATYEAECTTPTTHKCEYTGGKYYDAQGNVVSEINYIISCQAPKCKIVNGYYFGKNGNNVSKATYEAECTTPVSYLYEYERITGTQFSNWTAWSDWSKEDCATKEVNCNDSDASCLFKLQKLVRKEKIGTYQKTYAKKRNIVKQTGSYVQKACNNYNYVEINKTLYATTTTTTYTTVNEITVSTTRTVGGWVYNGRGSYANPPADTATTHYTFAGADYSGCGESCTSLPSYYYDSYTYTGDITSVSSTTTPGKTTSTTTTTTTPVSQETSYEASCGGYTEKTIPIYGTVTVTEKATRTEPLYGDVCYKSTKTRKITSQGKRETTWSSNPNDTSLINAGWKPTGTKKQK